MYTNDLGNLGQIPPQKGAHRPIPVETLQDSDRMSPADSDALVNPEGVIFEMPSELYRDMREDFPILPTSPWQQIPPWVPKEDPVPSTVPRLEVPPPRVAERGKIKEMEPRKKFTDIPMPDIEFPIDGVGAGEDQPWEWAPPWEHPPHTPPIS